jgi:NAD(P)H-flavin reductase
LEAIAQHFENVKVVVTVTREKWGGLNGRVDAAMMAEVAPDYMVKLVLEGKFRGNVGEDSVFVWS